MTYSVETIGIAGSKLRLASGLANDRMHLPVGGGLGKGLAFPLAPAA